jgi:hypothetical protein
MALRDKPQARLTIDTPPYPMARASVAAIRRRLRSFNSGQTSANFCWSVIALFMIGNHSTSRRQLQPLFIDAALLKHTLLGYPFDIKRFMWFMIADINGKLSRLKKR